VYAIKKPYLVVNYPKASYVLVFVRGHLVFGLVIRSLRFWSLYCCFDQANDAQAPLRYFTPTIAITYQAVIALETPTGAFGWMVQIVLSRCPSVRPLRQLYLHPPSLSWI